MDIADIATREFVRVDAHDRLGKVRSIFGDANPKAIIVTEDDAYVGVITQRQLLGSQHDDDTKVQALMKPAPRVRRREDIRDTARLLVEGGTKAAPVFEGDQLWGIVTEDAILEAVLDGLDALDVGDIYTENVVVADEGTSLGQVINSMREHGVSRLPVVDDGRLTGMVTTHDILDVVVNDRQRATLGDRAGDVDRVLDLPTYDVMSSPVETVTRRDTVRAAVERMFEMDYAGLVVTPDGDGDAPAGILTKTDVLRALSYTERDAMDVQVTNVDLLDTISRRGIREAVTEVSDKYGEMQVQHVHVRFHEHKEKLRGTSLVQCQIRMRTDKGQAAGSGEGYGAENAFRVALDKLERNVLGMKGMLSDEAYRGQLLRKLGEL